MFQNKNTILKIKNIREFWINSEFSDVSCWYKPKIGIWTKKNVYRSDTISFFNQ